MNFGLGPLKYRNNSKVFGKERKVYGKSAGMNFGANVEYKLSDIFGIHFDISPMFCLIQTLTIDYHDKEVILYPPTGREWFSFNHCNFALGATIHF